MQRHDPNRSEPCREVTTGQRRSRRRRFRPGQTAKASFTLTKSACGRFRRLGHALPSAGPTAQLKDLRCEMTLVGGTVDFERKP